MSMTDPVADMLTRIRNANIARHDKVDVPASGLKKEIARILQEEGYIKRCEYLENEKQGTQGMLRIYLKYSRDKERTISGIQRISKPGRRVYVDKSNLPRVLNGLGSAIISTSHGVTTAAKCNREGIGGEVLCYIW